MKRVYFITQMLRESLIYKIRAMALAYFPSAIMAAGKFSSNLFRGQRGTSILEVVLALALLGTMGTAFLQAMSTGFMAKNAITEGVNARSLATSQLEDISKSAYQDTYPVTVEVPTGYSVSIDVTEVDANLQKIQVTVLQDGKPLLSLEDFKVTQ